MITHRPLAKEDIPMLQVALDTSVAHVGQKAEAYTGENMQSDIYEDSTGPIVCVCYTKSLRLCTAWYSEDDLRRNAVAILRGMQETIQRAKASGFTEILFDTESEKMRKFMSHLGFKTETGTMVLSL
jgi:hypothetical protein